MRDDVYNTKEGFQVPEAHHPSDEDLLRLESGDTSIVNELTENLSEYALTVVSHFIRVKPNYTPYQEDLNSVALVVMLEALHDQLGHRFQSLGLLTYLRKRIEGACLDHAIEMPGHSLPARSARRLDKIPEQEPLRDYHLIDEDPFAEIEFDDFVDVKFNQQQQQIIRLRRAGHTLKEVATTLKLKASELEGEVATIRKVFETEYFD